eukprot:TRINITY_DN14015_c0_g1_i1.p1 TRINITY_DN14015_c0_g1~~TRINITY_DN14015_c0_g1_i1.p1  ORF type:complete len:508 (+),score=126.32 TRINITY_DN14015_c0_g1_i1:119-1525(+)
MKKSSIPNLPEEYLSFLRDCDGGIPLCGATKLLDLADVAVFLSTEQLCGIDPTDYSFADMEFIPIARDARQNDFLLSLKGETRGSVFFCHTTLLSDKTTSNEALKDLLLYLCDSFDTFLHSFLNAQQKIQRDKKLLEAKTKALKTQPLSPALTKLCKRYANPFPLLEQHIRNLITRLDGKLLAEDISAEEEEMLLMRIISIAVYFIQSVKRSRKKGKNADNSDDDSVEDGVSLYEIVYWVQKYFLGIVDIEDADAIDDENDKGDEVRLSAFISEEDMLQLFLGRTNELGFDPFDIEVAIVVPEREDEEETKEGEEEEDLLFRLPEFRKKRIERMLKQPPLTSKEEAERLVDENGEPREKYSTVLKEIFKRFDTDQDNLLNLKEFNAYLSASGSSREALLQNDDELRACTAAFSLQEDDQQQGDTKDPKVGVDWLCWVRMNTCSLMEQPQPELLQLKALNYEFSLRQCV